MTSKTLFLVCNAHLDPVWLWEWEEGLAETLSTFRAAAGFCEEFDGFVFNHNESVLYQWVETHEPELFDRIRALVEEGRWHITGGWVLQPDCNLPSGESFVRQILKGKGYFRRKFDVEPTVAVNLDPFGHSRGLVQILTKAGYRGYLFCRPGGEDMHLPGDDFIWTGYGGSEILAHRAPDHYNSERGKAGEKIRKWIDSNSRRRAGLLLWGIGNHGGGPSREDLKRIDEVRSGEKEWDVRHGTPEDYFDFLEGERDALGRYSEGLNPWAVGCYTTMALLKQKHRLLENTYYTAEKMVTNAALQNLMDYPGDALHQALEDLLFCQFHDALPGSSIPEVEASSLQRMSHGLEIASRLRARAFFALLAGQKPAEEGEFPIFVYNPHPRDVEETVACELQPPEPNPDGTRFLLPEIRDSKGNAIAYQLEKEQCNILADQRKRLIFRTTLSASTMTRFSCRIRVIEAAGEKPGVEVQDRLTLKSDACATVIDGETGLLDGYRVNGVEYLRSGSFRPIVAEDTPDPWGMKVKGFRNIAGSFSLMSPEESARFAGVSSPRLSPVRIIEEGPIRWVVEALFRYETSSLCMRYKIPREGNEIEVEVRVFWMEKDRMLKLSIPTCFEEGTCRGQVAYGVEEFSRHGEELVAQKWVGVCSSDRKWGLTVVNSGTYGFDFEAGELRLSLLRSPAYAGHPVDGRRHIVRQDRFEPRIDQGERVFRFWLQAGPAGERFAAIGREALVKNEPPVTLCCYPPDSGQSPLPGVTLSGDVVQLAALKMSEDGHRLIVRLFEPTGDGRETTLRIPCLDLETDLAIGGHEIKTLAVDLSTRKICDVDLLEREPRKGVQAVTS